MGAFIKGADSPEKPFEDNEATQPSLSGRDTTRRARGTLEEVGYPSQKVKATWQEMLYGQAPRVHTRTTEDGATAEMLCEAGREERMPWGLPPAPTGPGWPEASGRGSPEYRAPERASLTLI